MSCPSLTNPGVGKKLYIAQDTRANLSADESFLSPGAELNDINLPFCVETPSSTINQRVDACSLSAEDAGGCVFTNEREVRDEYDHCLEHDGKMNLAPPHVADRYVLNDTIVILRGRLEAWESWFNGTFYCSQCFEAAGTVCGMEHVDTVGILSKQIEELQSCITEHANQRAASFRAFSDMDSRLLALETSTGARFTGLEHRLEKYILETCKKRKDPPHSRDLFHQLQSEAEVDSLQKRIAKLEAVCNTPLETLKRMSGCWPLKPE
jgi:hypothetical protein